MDLASVDKIAKAVLYEGYMLYPYRPSSVKNQQRWNFGVLCPQAYCNAQEGSEASIMQTECLLEGSSRSTLEVRVRFLQLISRSVGKFETSADEFSTDASQLPAFQLTNRLEVNGRVYQPWQEAVEREVIVPACGLETIGGNPFIQPFSFCAGKQFEPLRDAANQIVGVLIREGEIVSGEVAVSAKRLDDGLFKINVQIRNLTPFTVTANTVRENALQLSLVSTHTVVGVEQGAFVSLLAPPDWLTEVAAACKNIGTWPVLVGDEGQRDTVLSSPIILYDYPQIAPESAGDLFDGTEIDEILSLRIMTLTDDEKLEMSQSDERARQMLERTEAMPAEQFMKLHGVLRGLRPIESRTSEPRVSQEERL